MCHDVVVVDMPERQFSALRLFPKGEDMIFFWYGETYVKKNSEGERERAPYFVIFVVWSALVVGGWVVAAWGKKSYLGSAEISSTVYLV